MEVHTPCNEGGFGKLHFDQPGGVGGGGFLNSTMNSPSTSEKKKSDRITNIVCCTIAQIHQMDDADESLKIGSMSAKIIKFIGLVKSVDLQSTKVTYIVDDYTGPSIEVQIWLSENEENSDHVNVVQENSYACVIGAVRSLKGKRHVIAFNVSALKNINMIATHIAECIHNSMSIAVMDKQANSTSLYTTCGTSSADVNTDTFGSDMRRLTKPQQLVKQAIMSCKEERGISIMELTSTLQSLNRQTIQEALDFLGNEGHIYSTIDEDHYKSTDYV